MSRSLVDVSARIEISSSIEHVWNVLSGFPSYPLWNPFIRRTDGGVEQGCRFKAYVEPHEISGVHLRGRILELNAPREMRLRARFLAPGVLGVEHVALLEDTADGVVLEQSEHLVGILVAIFGQRLRVAVQNSLEHMNLAVKVVAERQTSLETSSGRTPRSENGSDGQKASS